MRCTAAKSEFTVGSFTYVIEFESGEFRLYIDDRQSRTKIHAQPYARDDFYGYTFQDTDGSRIYETSRRTSTRHAVSVYHAAMQFVAMVVHTIRPHRFSFSANEARKIKLYRSLAITISSRYGYQSCVSGNNFIFYRLAD